MAENQQAAGQSGTQPQPQPQTQIPSLPQMFSAAVDDGTDAVTGIANSIPDDQVNAMQMLGCWLKILEHFFPSQHMGPNFPGYDVSSATSAINNRGTLSVRITASSRWVGANFLNVELERFPSSDDDLDRWDREANLMTQMVHTMRHLPDQEEPKVVFGIVVVGKFSRFYRLEEDGQGYPIDVAGKAVFHMRNDARLIAYIMEVIIKEHW
ncbi:uncharacterized protein BO66DRAFT_443865 [Aspergillus aculeatinus CBS 121060]|uniref:Uncharacterized protein n=1 Tax=Aspergillus aculeatinus CBS 121060 TaxID=1448322 RepID=A0ACD1GTH5_9EURO|nr:hypothetical protein BO66DRAFT_443865 [Aspergillus aculeatinus CBS 121060]RAH64574.1 hypothetical protein BO66DRAFT_443865 [Aspergillus aculeatinus CBS 121060]